MDLEEAATSENANDPNAATNSIVTQEQSTNEVAAATLPVVENSITAAPTNEGVAIAENSETVQSEISTTNQPGSEDHYVDVDINDDNEDQNPTVNPYELQALNTDNVRYEIEIQRRNDNNDTNEVAENEVVPNEIIEPVAVEENEREMLEGDAIPFPVLEYAVINNDDMSSASNDSSESDDIIHRYGPPYGYANTDRVHAALRELISESRRSDAIEVPTLTLTSQDSFMQRLRRALFSIDRNRQHDPTGGGGGGGGDGGGGDDDGDGDSDADDGDGRDLPIDGDNDNEILELDELENEERIEEEIPENAVTFDTNLPAEHSYLGSNMNRVSGVNYLDVGHRYKMLLFMHQHVLFPGEVLPFMISNALIENDIDATNGLLFGLVFVNLIDNDQEEVLYGVTCQIYEKGGDERGNVLVKSRALQRFTTKKSELSGPLQYLATHPEIKCYGYVQILAEIYLPEPLKCINMGSMNRFRDNPSMKHTFKRYQAATTPWPAHIYDYYSISSIIEEARTQLAEHKINTMPTDPVQLSFWLVRNLHLSEDMMRTIFMTDSVNTRMKLMSSTFKKDAIYICRYCGNRIAKCSELFAMSKHGVQSQYCNSAGYIHETNTVYQLLRDAVSYNGSPSTEFSWFPGYQWHIILCKICARHIGWEFKAIEPNLVPKQFFGISSYSVRVSSARTSAPTNPRAAIFRNFLRMSHRGMQ